MNIYALVWSITAAVGAALSGWLVFESALDLRALGGLRNGRRVLARARLTSEAIRMVIHLAFLYIGLLALGSAPGPLSVTILILLGGNIGLILNSLIALYVRRELEMPTHEAPLTAEELVARAQETAADLRSRAEESAVRLLALATRTARELDRVELDRATSRSTEAAERTAENTERIADNTDPAR